MTGFQINSASLESDQVSAAAFHSPLKADMGDKDPSKTFIKDVNQLEKEHPKLFKSFVESMAREICRELHKHAKRMKTILRNNQR